METEKSILSCAALIGELLGEDEAVKKNVRMFYPVIAPDKAVCPYVVYRLASLNVQPVKVAGHADTAQIEVMCCGSTYEQSVKASEAVRMALDGIQGESDDGKLRMRSCLLSGATEGWDSQTFYRTLTFTVKIN